MSTPQTTVRPYTNIEDGLVAVLSELQGQYPSVEGTLVEVEDRVWQLLKRL